MPITFPCSSCGKTLKTPDDSSGKQGKCPHCGAQMVIPSSTSALGNTPSTGHSDPFAAVPGSSTSPRFRNQPPAKPKPNPAQNPFAQQAPTPSSPYASPGYVPPHSAGYGAGYSGTAEGIGSKHASLILALGIISVVTGSLGYIGCCCVPIGALVQLVSLAIGMTGALMGFSEMKKYNAGVYGRAGRSETQAGFICGIIGSSLAGLFLLGGLGWLAFIIVMAASS